MKELSDDEGSIKSLIYFPRFNNTHPHTHTYYDMLYSRTFPKLKTVGWDSETKFEKFMSEPGRKEAFPNGYI